MNRMKQLRRLIQGIFIIVSLSSSLHADDNYFALGVGDSSNYELWTMPEVNLLQIHKNFTDFAGAGVGTVSGRDMMYVGFVYGISYYGIFVPVRLGVTYQHYDDKGWHPGVLVQLGYVFGRINNKNWTAGIAVPIS